MKIPEISGRTGIDRFSFLPPTLSSLIPGNSLFAVFLSTSAKRTLPNHSFPSCKTEGFPPVCSETRLLGWPKQFLNLIYEEVLCNTFIQIKFLHILNQNEIFINVLS